MAGRTPGGCRATQRDSRDRVAGIAINARPRPAREGTPPLSASQLFTALAGRQRRYGLRRRPTWRIPSARKMGERPARKWQGSGAVVHGPPAADGGQPHPHFHARAAAPARREPTRIAHPTKKGPKAPSVVGLPLAIHSGMLHSSALVATFARVSHSAENAAPTRSFAAVT